MYRRLMLLACMFLPCCYAAPDLDASALANDAGPTLDAGLTAPVDAGVPDSGVPCVRGCQNGCRHDLPDAGPRDPALLQCNLGCLSVCGT